MQFSTLFLAVASLALTNASSLDLTKRTTGEATFYGGNVDGGTCSFSGYTIPAGLYGVAITDSSWDDAKTCGACVEVTGPKGNKITALVVDQCPGCGAGHLDLFPDAFAKLEDPVKGVIPVSWSYVSCPITSPITLRNKEGVSPYWFSVQVINASKRVEKLEYSTNGGGSWKSTTRKYYNYFEDPNGSGTSSVDVKVTSVDGDVVIVKNVKIGAGVTATAGGNFGGSSGGGSQPTPIKEVTPEPVKEVTPEPVKEETPAPVVASTTQAAQPTQEASQPTTNVAEPVATAIFQEEEEPIANNCEDTPTTSKVIAAQVPATTASPTTKTKVHPATTLIVAPVKAKVTEPAVVTVTITSCPAQPTVAKRSHPFLSFLLGLA